MSPTASWPPWESTLISPLQDVLGGLQDSQIELMEQGKTSGPPGTTALTVGPEKLERIYESMDFFGAALGPEAPGNF